MEQGFPRPITDDFPGVELKINAVLQAFGKKVLISLQWGFYIKMVWRIKTMFNVQGIQSYILLTSNS